MENCTSVNGVALPINRPVETTAPAADNARVVATSGQQRASASAPPAMPNTEAPQIVATLGSPPRRTAADAQADAVNGQLAEARRDLEALGMKLMASGNALAAQVLIMSLTAAAAPAEQRDACIQWLEGLIPQLAEADQTDVIALIAEVRAALAQQENTDVAAVLAQPGSAPSEPADDESPLCQVKNSFTRWRLAGDDSNRVVELIEKLMDEWDASPRTGSHRPPSMA